MEAITKNRQSRERLEIIVDTAFAHKEKLLSFKEFSGGFCNVSYRLDLSSGRSVVLKVAAPPEVKMMSCETALMETEIRAMQKAMEHGIEGVPEIYFYDYSKTVCSGNYFLMEMMPGQSYDKVKPDMSQEQQEEIELQIGQWLKNLNEIKGTQFGHFFREDLQKKGWYNAFRFMLERVIGDGLKKEVNLIISPRELLNQLEKDRPYFEEVKESSLIHFDSWDGNIFVNDGKVVGLIDWERAMWAESLMEDRFRSHTVSPGVMKGYEKEQFTKSEVIRCGWYDVYLYLIMMIEGAFRHYEDDGQYQWTSGLLQQVWKKLNSQEV